MEVVVDRISFVRALHNSGKGGSLGVIRIPVDPQKVSTATLHSDDFAPYSCCKGYTVC
jgi:hypothetical protein